MVHEAERNFDSDSCGHRPIKKPTIEVTKTKRPFEITSLAIIILLLAAIKIISYAMLLFIPEVWDNLISLGLHESENALIQFPLTVHYLISGISTAIYIVSGYALLRARHWSRLILATWSVWILLFSFLTTGSFPYLALKLPFFIIMLIVLFSPRANAYFKAE